MQRKQCYSIYIYNSGNNLICDAFIVIFSLPISRLKQVFRRLIAIIRLSGGEPSCIDGAERMASWC